MTTARMNASEFAAALATLGWSARHLLQMTGRHIGSGSNWAKADGPPVTLGEWLRRRVIAHEAMMRDDPPPGKMR